VFWKGWYCRDYVTTYFLGLMDSAKKIYVVVNGEIKVEGKRKTGA
jgi:hypothetical protein